MSEDTDFELSRQPAWSKKPALVLARGRRGKHTRIELVKSPRSELRQSLTMGFAFIPITLGASI